jgi:hypothetical protein
LVTIMARKSDSELLAIRESVSRVGRLSDSIFHLGPFSIGIDGILSWIPGVGEIYGTAAGAFILVQGARADVPVPVLATAALLMGVRTLADVVPIAGPLFADVFTAHKWAANMIVQAIDQQLGSPDAGAGQPAWRVVSPIPLRRSAT